MILVAKKTLDLFETIALDQGNTFRRFLKEETIKSSDAFRDDEKPHRTHMGASVIGRECPREVWYSFRWATRKKHSGKLLRLFNRGHMEEARFVALLRACGMHFFQHDAAGKQFRIVDELGHFGGSLDGVVIGVPEMPDVYLLTEFKTHGEKSFLKVKEEGVMSAKWEHYVQMNIYMGKMQLKAALYLAINKNTDEIYAEIILFDSAVYTRYLDRAYTLIQADKPPVRINNNPSWFTCKMCDHNPVCFGKVLPDRTCRSCAHVEIGVNRWHCGLDVADSIDLTEENQYAACADYRVIEGF